MLYKDDFYSCSKSKSVDKVLADSKELIIICQKNLSYVQELCEQSYNKDIEPRSYAFSNNILLNNKHIKTKLKQNLKAKFFRPFQVVHLIVKQVYKIELLRK